jgi:hypothetical protein
LDLAHPLRFILSKRENPGPSPTRHRLAEEEKAEQRDPNKIPSVIERRDRSGWDGDEPENAGDL